MSLSGTPTICHALPRRETGREEVVKVHYGHYIADLLARIADHPARRIAEFLPWNWQPLDATRAAA